jgi:hypothetical protein
VNAIRPIVPSRSFDLDLSARGYQVLFRANETNRCPGCGHAQWLVGRITAECCICGTALPLESSELAAAPARKAVALHVVNSARARSRGEVDHRREARQPGEGRVLALFVDGSPHPFAIDNISSGGVMGEAPPGIGEAQSLCVELEDGTMLPAEVKWTDGVAVGLAFVSPSGSRNGA